jgi:hypothetical protein
MAVTVEMSADVWVVQKTLENDAHKTGVAHVVEASKTKGSAG